MNTGNKIKAYRKAAGLTQTELGAAAGIRKSAVSMIENGVTEPSLKTLKAFSSRLGVPIEELLGEDPMDNGELSEAHIQIQTAVNYLTDEQARILYDIMIALGWD